MDSNRFDGLVRTFGQTRSRRQTLRALAGAAVGALVLGAREAAAGSRLGGATCDKPTQCASGTCLTSGKCSCSASVGCTKPANRCKQATCTAGRCVSSNTAKGTACPDDGNPCTKNLCDGSGRCTHPNKKNGTTCSTCQTGPCACQDGTCQSCPPGQCGTCASGQTKCNEQCVDTQTDPAHCGGCGNACQNGDSCESGMCTDPCPAGQTDCTEGCRDLATDPNNCGDCGKTCKNDQFCSSGQCTDCKKTCGPADCGTVSDLCGGEITCTGLGCTCPAQGTLCDLYDPDYPANLKPCNNDSGACAERADGLGNVCWNPSAGSQCGSGEPICQTDADCQDYIGSPLGRCIKAGTCRVNCAQTACVQAFS